MRSIFFGVILLLASTAVVHTHPGGATCLCAGFHQPSATDTNKPGAANWADPTRRRRFD